MVGRAKKVTAGGIVAEGLVAAGAGAERSRRSGSGGDRGGVQSQRLRGGGGDQSREAGQSQLPCSGGDRSRKFGRSRGLPGRGSDQGRGIGRSRLLGREPGEKRGIGALGHRDGCGGGAFLGLQKGEACLALPEGPRRVFKPSAGSGGVAVQSGEFFTLRN